MEGMVLPAKRSVRVMISDNGPGIPAAILDRIFDPYFSTKEGGSGLGLAICHSIISKHNGFISVVSPPGGGATFTILLPASTQPSLPPQGKEGVAHYAGGATIMVMDDEEVVRDVAQSILGMLGHTVLPVRDGAEAIRVYQERRTTGRAVDLILMDLTIPGGMGGKEAVQRILEIDPGARIIVSSGYSNDPIMAAFRDYGFSAAIAKPYRPDEMCRVINQVLAAYKNP